MSDLSRKLELRDQDARRLDAIIRTGHYLNTELDADELLSKILEAAAEALGLERAAILLYYPQQSELVLHAARGYGDVLGHRIQLGRGITGNVAITGEPALVNDVSRDPRYISGVVGGASEMSVPMKVYDELFGVLDTESPQRDAFTRRDLELFHAFAAQAATALHNARLFRRLGEANHRLQRTVDETRRLNQELETYAAQIAEANANLEAQIKQLTALHQAGQAITSSLNLKQTLNAILEMTSEIVQSSTAAISLMDQDTKELRVMAHAGPKGQDRADDLHYDLPLKVGERQIGVFELVRQANRRMGTGEHKILETLASQAAIAIENARLFEETQRTYYDTLKALAKALEARDDYTRGHSERVAAISMEIALELGLSPEDCSLIYNGALLHDIGKIGVRDAVLLSPRQLTTDEMAVIRKHPTFGNIILGPLKFLGKVSELVKHHHEHYDGEGYPSGLRGEEIPLAARIIAVADCYDAMTSDRPYRAALTHEQALEQMREMAGTQLDPGILQAFLHVIERRREDPTGPTLWRGGDTPLE